MNWRQILTGNVGVTIPVNKPAALRQGWQTFSASLVLLLLGVGVGILARGNWLIGLAGWVVGLVMLLVAGITLARIWLIGRRPWPSESGEVE